jgi:hypothetical protein
VHTDNVVERVLQLQVELVLQLRVLCLLHQLFHLYVEL